MATRFTRPNTSLFLCDNLKNVVYYSKPENISELQLRNVIKKGSEESVHRLD